MKIKEIYCEIQCVDCGTSFPTSKRCFKNRNPYCRKCVFKNNKQQRLLKLEEKKDYRNSLQSKICKKCNIEKTLEEFETCHYKDKPSTVRNSCIECEKKAKKNYYEYLVQNNLPLSANKSIESWIKKLLNKASQRNKIIDIDFDYLLELYQNQNGKCSLSGEELTFHKNNLSTNLSIDRINSNIGYIKGNVQLVCHYVNIMKWNKDLPELIEWCKKIINKTEG